jgi:hypothetical protein
MSNIQVTHDASPNNARSESAILINSNNPSQIVATSKKFNNPQTYDFTLATEYSTDGGRTWHDSAAFNFPPSATVMTDPTLAWDDSGNVFMVGLVGNNPPTRVFFRHFQAQTTSGIFDFPPGVHYRRAPSDPNGQLIPLAGIAGNEYVTIAYARKHGDQVLLEICSSFVD